MAELLLENNLTNDVSLEKKQNNFLQSNVGKAINTGLNIGLRYVLPDLIEDDVIEIKDTIIKNGFKEGMKTAIDSAINLGKSALGIVTGNFENVTQIQKVVKNGGIIDKVSDVLDVVIEKGEEKGKINNTIGKALKKGKTSILSSVERNIEATLNNQINSAKNVEKYINNWKEYYSNKDFDGMQKEYYKIEKELKKLVPIENTINNARYIENIHNLIKNNGKNFDLSSEELELAKKLAI